MINVHNIVNGITYNRDIPQTAKDIAIEMGYIIIVGGSDDLMYCYGANSYLSSHCDHSCGWEGSTLINIGDKSLEKEARQLGLEIYWCGKIRRPPKHIENYDVEKSGAFSYKVKDGIEFKDFIVYEDDKKDEVYCTGIIIKLPDNFKSYKEIK